MQHVRPTAEPPPPNSAFAAPDALSTWDGGCENSVLHSPSMMYHGPGFRDALTALLDEVEDRLVAQHEFVARERERAICAKFDAVQLENIELSKEIREMRKITNGHLRFKKEEDKLALPDVTEQQHPSRPMFPGEQLHWSQQASAPSRSLPPMMANAISNKAVEEVVLDDPFPDDMPMPACERTDLDRMSGQVRSPAVLPVMNSVRPVSAGPDELHQATKIADGHETSPLFKASSLEQQGCLAIDGPKTKVSDIECDLPAHLDKEPPQQSVYTNSGQASVYIKSDSDGYCKSERMSITASRTSVQTNKTTEAERTFRMIQKIAQSVDQNFYYHPHMSGARGIRNQLRAQLAKTDESIDIIMGVLIILNAVQIGLSSDMSRTWKGWMVLDCFFAVSFVIEMVLKIRIHTLKGHLCGPNWVWSCFDAVMTLQAILEVALTFLHVNAVKLSLFRIVRLLRLTRILRLLRLPVFKDLLMMIDGVIGGSRTLGWSIVLLVFPLYAVAICFRETLGQTTDGTQHSELFESLGESFFTVFRCVMGDCNDDKGSPIFVHVSRDHGWYYGAFYCAIVTLTSFGLFNVIIAIYVENTVVAAKSNEKVQRRRRLSDQKRLAVLSMHLVDRFVSTAKKRQERQGIQEADAAPILAESLDITADLFSEVMQDSEVQWILDQLDIATEDRMDLFEILDADGGGTLKVSELLQGIRRLRGDARRSDVIANGLVIRALQDNFDEFAEAVKARQREMKDNLRRNGEISARLEEKFDLFQAAVRDRQLQMVANVEKNGEYARKLQDKFDAFASAVKERQVAMTDLVKNNGSAMKSLMDQLSKR